MFNITAEACQAVAAAIAAAANDPIGEDDEEDEGEDQNEVDKDTAGADVVKKAESAKDTETTLKLIVRLEEKLNLKFKFNDDTEARLQRIERVIFGKVYKDLAPVARCQKACTQLFGKLFVAELAKKTATDTAVQGQAAGVKAVNDADLVKSKEPEPEPKTEPEATAHEPVNDLPVHFDKEMIRRRSVGSIAAAAAAKQADHKRAIRKELIKTNSWRLKTPVCARANKKQQALFLVYNNRNFCASVASWKCSTRWCKTCRKSKSKRES